MPFPHEAILGSDFFSALVDAFLYHSWPSATRDKEMHQLVLRKSQTLELPHVEKIHSSTIIASLGATWVPKEAKFFREVDFFGLVRCFSVKNE